jgi:NADPH:quinone reductase-like Zn-dependent oxidoreductase
MGVHRHGGYAELVRVPAQNVFAMPAKLGFEEAACLPLSFAVTWKLLVNVARVQPGEVVLIMAAGSGLGVAGIQIARLRGARVLAGAGSDEKLARAAELGAEAGVNYATSDLAKEVRRLTDGWGADVVFENIGADLGGQRGLAGSGRPPGDVRHSRRQPGQHRYPLPLPQSCLALLHGRLHARRPGVRAAAGR